MVVTPQVIVPTLLVPLLAYRIYRRIRSSFGKQPIQTNRMTVRVVLLAAVGSLLLWIVTHSIVLLATAAGSIALGGALAALGLWLTHWHSDETGSYYTPNSYLGALISAALIARITYRLFSITPPFTAPPATGGDFFASFQHSPLTLAMLMITIGYYLVYFTGLLLVARSRPTTSG